MVCFFAVSAACDPAPATAPPAASPQPRVVSAPSSGALPDVLLPEANLPRPMVPPIARLAPSPFTAHGVTYADDYAWLRKPADDPEVAAYLEAENNYARATLAPAARLESTLARELVSRVATDDDDAPWRAFDYFYYDRVRGQDEHPVSCRRARTVDGPEEILVDPNAIAGFVALGPRDASPRGRYFAYGADTGEGRFDLFVRDVARATLLGERMAGVTSVAFADEDHLFYVQEEPTTRRPYRVLRHVTGTAPERDALVFEERDPRFEVDVHRSRDRRFVVITSASHTTSEVALVPVDRPKTAAAVVLSRAPGVTYDVEPQGTRLLLRIDDAGATYRLVAAADIAAARARRFTTLVPAREDVTLEGVAAFRGHVVLVERASGLPRLSVLDTRVAPMADAAPLHVIPARGAAYALALAENADFDAPFVRFSFAAPNAPPTIVDYDLTTHERRIAKVGRLAGAVDLAAVEVQRIEIASRDGARIPVTLVTPAGARPDASRPLVLEAYGAYGLSNDPGFSLAVLSLLQRGASYAIAHVRGGGELGRAWHEAGRLRDKHHSAEDFVDVAAGLAARGWAKPGAIGAVGESAGGLAVAAAVNQRPDLFKAMVLRAPFVDLLATMRDPSAPLTVGEREEWGDPAKPAELAWMAAYSPYDNLGAKPYPATLIRTSVADRGVMFWESARYAARRRAVAGPLAGPLVLRTATDPGARHEGRAGRFARLRDEATDLTFLLWQLGAWGVPLPEPSAR